ncbi:MAG TPA: FAD-binding oxidoreductase [Stellaceae bacterium]|nr:FAD-binding oxidoreductase [Stellaceae bacterium]
MDARARLSRRNLLVGAGATLALPWVMRGARAAPSGPIADAAWQKLATQISGGVIWPGDPRFVTLSRPENLRYYNPPANPDGPSDPDAPFAVVRPHGAKEVADTILWARDAGCRMVPRSGGHSYAGCSTVHGLVVHGGAMRQVKYHLDSKLLEVGGGVINGDIFTALRDTDRAIIHGRCTAVGISAFLMGGGIGMGMREYGVGCDQVESVELVLANGKTVRASASSNPEFFWAVRGGGGGNLGYATRWWLRTVPADKVVAFNVNWWPKPGNPDVFKRLVRVLEASPAQMGAQMSISAGSPSNPGAHQISLTGQFRGTLATFQTVLGSALSDASQKSVLELPHWQAQEFLEIAAVPNRYQETSLFAAELSDSCIDQSISLLQGLPSNGARARLTFFLTGGQINKIRPDATAFAHRSSQWLINFILEWDRADGLDDNLKWQRNLQDTVAGILGESSSYQNFADPGLNNHAQGYWGTNLARLSKIKHAFDPDGVFTPPRHQEIPQSA